MKDAISEAAEHGKIEAFLGLTDSMIALIKQCPQESSFVTKVHCIIYSNTNKKLMHILVILCNYNSTRFTI